MMNVTMIAWINKLVKDYNNYSELVALNYAKKKEGECDETTLQWNRGHMYCIDEYLKELADTVGVQLEYECNAHSFGYGDWQRTLEYQTVRAILPV